MSLAARASRARLLAAILALAAGLSLGGPAAALGLSPDPVVWSYASGSNSIQLSHDLVSVVTGLPAGGVVLAGAVGSSDVTLVFQAHVELTGSSYTQVTTIGIRAPATSTLTAAGWIPGSEPDALTDFGVGALLGTDAAIGFVNAEFPDGATSDLFFVSYDHLAVGDVLGFQPLNSLVFVPVMANATIVPEPASASLLAVGLGGLALRRAARRRGAA